VYIPQACREGLGDSEQFLSDQSVLSLRGDYTVLTSLMLIVFQDTRVDSLLILMEWSFGFGFY